MWAYVLPDALGSVRQLVDAAGQVTLAQSYDPFGVLSSQYGTQNPQLPFGYAGEQEDPSTGLVFLRARYHDPEVVRFIAKDLFSGFVNTPQSLNRWVYVESNPVNRTDPTGLWSPYCQTGRCGPSIDAWFLEEINIHWGWVAVKKAEFDEATSNVEKYFPGPLIREIFRLERHGEWIVSHMQHCFKAIPHKWMDFSNLVSDCPSSEHCRDSVTLCNTCLERSELGNFLYGLTAKVADLANWETFTGGHDKAHGLQKPWDQAAAGVGYYVAQNNLRMPDVDTMCRILRSSTGAWEIPGGLRRPGTTAWSWGLVQDEKVKSCAICEKAVPSSTPHTMPAFAGEPVASDRVYAGAPYYEYCEEQIPEGMMDPRLYIKFPKRVPRHP